MLLGKYMKVVHEGDKGQGICDTCKGMVATTYRVRDVEFGDGYGTAKNVLAAVCDVCDTVVALPHQSIPLITAQMEELKSQRDEG
jgi:hypothetical protein